MLGSGMEPDGLYSGTITNTGDNGMENTTMTPDNGNSIMRFLLSTDNRSLSLFLYKKKPSNRFEPTK